MVEAWSQITCHNLKAVWQPLLQRQQVVEESSENEQQKIMNE